MYFVARSSIQGNYMYNFMHCTASCLVLFTAVHVLNIILVRGSIVYMYV